MFIEVRNDLTKKFDEYLTNGCKEVSQKSASFSTYIWWSEYNYKLKSLPIRFPGATRGTIIIDDNDIIIDIILDDELCFDNYKLCCYSRLLLNEISKFIGTKLDLSSIKK